MGEGRVRAKAAIHRRAVTREDDMTVPRLRSIQVLLSLLSFCFVLDASAQEPAASCAADAKTGTLVVRYTPDLSEETPAWPEKPEPVHFFKLLVLDSTGSMVEDTQIRTFKFKLRSDVFEVLLEPGVPNVNLQGMCGGAVTGIVTVTRNAMKILDAKEFEGLDCFNREKYIRRITFRAGSSKPEMLYGKYPE
jgi:hypothetical protein